MGGPEATYAAMTSGDPGALAESAADLRKAMHDVQDAIELIRFAADKPVWSSPSARTRFNMAAWATRVTAEVAFIRLNRALLAVSKVRADYPDMVSAADQVIGQWRTIKASQVDGFFLVLLRAAVLKALADVRDSFGTEIAEAIDFLQSDPLTADQQCWLRDGLATSMRYDLEHPGELGPIIPNTLATGDDGDRTPQGLGYDPASGLLLQTTYTDGGSQLSLVDPETGEQVGVVDLGAATEDGGSTGSPDHGGGVAVHDGMAYVMSSGHPPRMFTYSMHDIRSAAPGETVPVKGTPQEMPAGAYSTIADGTLYVGSFTQGSDDPGQLWSYTYDAGRHTWVQQSGPHPTPPQTQGVTVRGHEVVFSTSSGRGNAASLQSYDLGDVTGRDGGSLPDPIRSVSLPNMAEGVVATPEGILTTYESGSESYSTPYGSASLDDLWASMQMTVTPYDQLGLADGGVIDVEPATLSQASSSFDQAESGLHAGEKSIAALTLPAGSLGDVPQGSQFATALVRHGDETSDWLSQGKVAAGVTASGLVSAATAYDDSDSFIGGLIGRLNPFGD